MTKKLIILSSLILMTVGFETGHAKKGFFPAKTDVIALLRDDLFIGNAVSYLDRTGTINIHSAIDPSKKCVGGFRYTGLKTGSGRVTCSDGEIVNFQFKNITALSGYGYGKSSRGNFSFTYGLSLKQAKKRLGLPENITIEKTKPGFRLRGA